MTEATDTERAARAEAEERDVEAAVEHLAGPAAPETGPWPVSVCLVRDAEVYIEPWIEHQRRIGSGAIVLLDNGSADRTVDRARQHPDVAIFRCELPFARWKRAMRRWLIHHHARGGWCLCTDIDEFFDWPGSDRIPLESLTGYLDDAGFTAVVAYMLDLVPDILDEAAAGGDFRATHRYFDLEAIREAPYAFRGNELSESRITDRRGGIRDTLFGFQPWITKHPLFRCDGGALPYLDDSHTVEQARIADFTTVLYHYKFAGNFQERVERAVREGNYWKGSQEYQAYDRRLKDDPAGIGRLPSSIALAGRNPAMDLLDRGFLVASPRYQALLGED